MPVYLIAALVSVTLVVISGFFLFRYLCKKEAKSMLTEFQQKFPGRCPICAYHDYGVREGFIPPSPPDEHPGCLTKTKRDTDGI